jgi:hypothetical protein
MKKSNPVDGSVQSLDFELSTSPLDPPSPLIATMPAFKAPGFRRVLSPAWASS